MWSLLVAIPSSTGHLTFPRGTLRGFELHTTLCFDHRPSVVLPALQKEDQGHLLKETETTMKFGLFSMVQGYLHSMRLVQREKEAWSGREDVIGGDNSSKVHRRAPMTLERKKMIQVCLRYLSPSHGGICASRRLPCGRFVFINCGVIKGQFTNQRSIP